MNIGPKKRIAEQQSERNCRYFEDNPDARERNRQLAIQQWDDDDLRAWRSAKTRQQWQDPDYRQQHSDVVSEWWREHPEHREKIVSSVQRTWQNQEHRETILNALADWRSSTSTAEKGTVIKEGHRLKALQILRQALQAEDIKSAYQTLRTLTVPHRLAL